MSLLPSTSRGLAAIAVRPPSLFLPHEKAAARFFGFFTVNIRDRNTRRGLTTRQHARFSDWCEGRGVLDLAGVKPPHVAAYVEELSVTRPEGPELSKPTVKQHLAALRMLFDWLVVGHVIDNNPAHAVRGPKCSRRKARRRCSTARKRGRLSPRLTPARLPACAFFTRPKLERRGRTRELR